MSRARMTSVPSSFATHTSVASMHASSAPTIALCGFSSMRPRLAGRLVVRWRGELSRGARYESAGDVGEALVAVPGVIAQHVEGAAHVDGEPLGELALGLLDHDPAVQRGLEVLRDGFAAAHVALVQQPDGSHIGTRTPDP